MKNGYLFSCAVLLFICSLSYAGNTQVNFYWSQSQLWEQSRIRAQQLNRELQRNVIALKSREAQEQMTQLYKDLRVRDISRSNPNASQVRAEFFNDVLKIAFRYDFQESFIHYFNSIQKSKVNQVLFAQIAYAAYPRLRDQIKPTLRDLAGYSDQDLLDLANYRNNFEENPVDACLASVAKGQCSFQRRIDFEARDRVLAKVGSLVPPSCLEK